MSRDAIAHFAEAREIDKKPLFEEGWDGIVQIGRFREQPQFVDDEWGIRSGSKEIGNEAKAGSDLTFKGLLGDVLRIGSTREKGHYWHVTPWLERVGLSEAASVTSPAWESLCKIAQAPANGRNIPPSTAVGMDRTGNTIPPKRELK